MRRPFRYLILILLTSLVAASCTDGGDNGGGDNDGTPPGAGSYPREETLFTSGTQWGAPSSWNPLTNWQYSTGTIGLLYETLFLYDPLTDEFEPWLAESGEWTDETTYELKLREGLTWSDGEPLTSADVVFTVELGKIESVPYHPLWDWLESAAATDEQTVVFSFSDPRYQQWANWVYFHAIVPKHVWENFSDEDVAAGANEDPVGSGPYLYQTHSQDRMVWVENEDWWAKEAMDLDVKPKYIVDIVNSSNESALGLLLQGGIDLSNNFLPGIATLIDGGYDLGTYYADEPYMLSANTAWLVLNTTKKPMDDPEFRRAVAHAIDVDKIVDSVYGRIVRKADPTGLVPTWDKYIDQEVVDELGFSYDEAEAKQIMADAGYADTNGDGFVEAPDGSEIKLTLIVPSGWTDWEESAKVIAEGAKAAGINVVNEFPADTALQAARINGDYDMLINNERQIDNTPWMYYDYIFRNPVLEQQTTVNFGRYENAAAWALVEELDGTPVDDLEGMRAITSQLQEIQLTEMPVIPLWYNGMWAQYSNSVWTNWPSESADTPNYVPTTWRGYFQRGAIKMLTELELAPEDEG